MASPIAGVFAFTTTPGDALLIGYADGETAATLRLTSEGNLHTSVPVLPEVPFETPTPQPPAETSPLATVMGGPADGLPDADHVGLAVKNAQVQCQHQQDKRDKCYPNPDHAKRCPFVILTV